MGLYKLALLGDSGVGKTSLVWQLCHNDFMKQYDPSILESFRAKLLVNDELCALEILDSGGQEDELCLEIQRCDGFVLVYNASSRSSFSRVERFVGQLQHMESFAPPPQSADSHNLVPLLLVGNKSDLDRQVSSKEGRELARELNCKFIETSAKENINVEAAFVSITQTLKAVKNVQTTAVEEPRFLPVLLGPLYSCFGF